MQDIVEILEKPFGQLFGNTSSKLNYFFAPGRVNLIGEHTDYNGGHVFPCALDAGTYAAVMPNSTSLCRVYSLNFKDAGLIEFNLQDLQFNPKHGWANYLKGVTTEFIKKGITPLHGFDLVIYGNIPNGAGLSSSASIEVLTAIILNHYWKGNFDPTKLALIGQAAENNYIGVNCGIMDQFISALGKNNSAILLNCNTLNYQYVPLNLGDYTIIIANTNKPRSLADSKYNERREQCQAALQIIKNNFNVTALGEITLSQLEQCQDLFDNEVLFKRARHAVSENERTLNAVAFLEKNDLIQFGRLMYQSHLSLDVDYDVAGKELNSLVTHAINHNGCIGAKMTGAGFGGCTVNLVKSNLADDFISSVSHKYFTDTGLKPGFYQVKPSQGAHQIYS